MWLSYLLRIRHAGPIGKPHAEGRASSRERGSPALREGLYAYGCLLEMLVGNVPYRGMRRPVMGARLMMAALGVVMLRPGVMRPRMVMRRRRGRGVMVMGSGFGFRGSENGGCGNCAEYGGEAKQERTAAETRGFGTLHNDLSGLALFLYRISDGFDFIIPLFLIVAMRSGFRILSYACKREAELKHLLQGGRGLEQLTPRKKRLS